MNRFVQLTALVAGVLLAVPIVNMVALVNFLRLFASFFRLRMTDRATFRLPLASTPPGVPVSRQSPAGSHACSAR